jgi:hypothetical protein
MSHKSRINRTVIFSTPLRFDGGSLGTTRSGFGPIRNPLFVFIKAGLDIRVSGVEGMKFAFGLRVDFQRH